jgi:hypothetical protein
MLWPTVSRPVFLGAKPPSRTQDQISVSVRQLRVCWCGKPSLRTGYVWRLQSLLALANVVILELESCRTHEHILPSHIRQFPNFEGQVPPEKGGPVVRRGAGFPFRCLLLLAGLRWKYSNPTPRGDGYNCHMVLFISSWHGPRRKRLFHYCCSLLLQWKYACLRSRYLALSVI